MDEKKYQVCASCTHFEARRIQGEMVTRCKRLGYETKPSYSFDCWTPKPHVRKLMEKRRGEKNE